MVMQQLLFKNMQKCTYAYGGWSIFTEKCTPAVTSLAIKVIEDMHNFRALKIRTNIFSKKTQR